MYHLEGKSYREISKQVGMPENSIGADAQPCPLQDAAGQRRDAGCGSCKEVTRDFRTAPLRGTLDRHAVRPVQSRRRSNGGKRRIAAFR